MVDTSIAGLSNSFGNLMTGNIGALMVKVMVWFLIIGAVAIVFGILYLVIVYRYKVTIFKVYGSGKKEGSYSIGKQKTDFARVQKDGSWKFLLKRKEIEPIESRYIYAGNRAYMYDMDGVLMPGKIMCENENFQIEPIPFSVRKKTELELQQLQQDFAKLDAWEANKIFIYTLIGCAFICFLAGFVLWMAFKKTDSLIPALNSFTSGLSNINTISGKG